MICVYCCHMIREMGKTFRHRGKLYQFHPECLEHWLSRWNKK